MSSHHFVKEDQEPALLILNSDAIPFEKTQELLEWSPLVIVSYYALEKVLRWGIKIDVLLTSYSVDHHSQLAIDQAPLHLIHLLKGQNELESVCEFLSNRKQVNLNVITGEAPDMFLTAASVSKSINIVLFDGMCRWHFVADGYYSKWLPANAVVKVVSNNQIEETTTTESGVFKLEQPGSFWVGEEY